MSKTTMRNAPIRSVLAAVLLLVLASPVLCQDTTSATSTDEGQTTDTQNGQAGAQATPPPAEATPESAEDKQRQLAEALIKSAELGRTDLMGVLLQSGVGVNATVPGLGSPLIGAARGGQVDVVDQLLRRGADPDLAVPGSGSPLIQAAANGHHEIVARLLQAGADPALAVPAAEADDDAEMLTALGEAKKAGHDAIVELLQAALDG